MKILEFNKHKKKIKITKLNHKIIVKGPLGDISFDLPNTNLSNSFISTKSLNYFSSQIKKCIKSVSTG